MSIFLKAIGNATVISLQTYSINRTGSYFELGNFNKESLESLIQEFEEKRLYTDDVPALFLAAGHILNSEGTGSAGLINNNGSGGTGGTWDGSDDQLRAEVGSRATNYVNIFNNALLS